MQDIKKYIPKIITISGVFIIILGLITILIPSLATPNYRLYKNSNDVTDLYLTSNDEENCVYSLSNEEDSKVFAVNYSYDFDSFTNTLGSININTLYADNNLSSDKHSISLFLNVVIGIEGEFEEFVNSNEYKLLSVPSIYLSSTLNKQLSDTLEIGGNNLTYSFKEIKFDFATSDLIDRDLKVYINALDKLLFSDNSGNFYDLELYISDIDLWFFVG